MASGGLHLGETDKSLRGELEWSPGKGRPSHWGRNRLAPREGELAPGEGGSSPWGRNFRTSGGRRVKTPRGGTGCDQRNIHIYIDTKQLDFTHFDEILLMCDTKSFNLCG